MLYLFLYSFFFFFFFNDTATTEIYTLSLHDALPILFRVLRNYILDSLRSSSVKREIAMEDVQQVADVDRKSTRLNSSHPSISYAVFCLKKKNKKTINKKLYSYKISECK